MCVYCVWLYGQGPLPGDRPTFICWREEPVKERERRSFPRVLSLRLGELVGAFAAAPEIPLTLESPNRTSFVPEMLAFVDDKLPKLSIPQTRLSRRFLRTWGIASGVSREIEVERPKHARVAKPVIRRGKREAALSIDLKNRELVVWMPSWP